jgi:hypothetical protein
MIFKASGGIKKPGGLKYLAHVKKFYAKHEIVFLHAPDIAYPASSTVGYDIVSLYEDGVVFQREIMDCSFYAPTVAPSSSEEDGDVDGEAAHRAGKDRRNALSRASRGGQLVKLSTQRLPLSKSEVMKRCVWYHNKNCFDDVNVQLTLQRKGLKEYPWSWPRAA